jgi:GDP-mannose 6-dehydrogenase
MKISIFGLGYVGTVSLGCLARDGHTVVGVDIDQHKLNLIRDGKSPIIEQGMTELIANAVASGRVTVTDDIEQAVHNTDVSFICVGTPSRANGSQDLTAIHRLSRQMGDALRTHSGFHAFVVRSTVIPGTVEGVVKPLVEKQSSKQAPGEFDVCFQPEFLREGTSIKDYDNPPLTIVGTESDRTERMLREIFGGLPGEFIRTSIPTAEMLKYVSNMFHAAKITFANEVGRIAQALNVDSHAVMDLMCRDERLNISRAYLRPGFAFGGSCLPKDLKAMLYAAKTCDVATPMLSGILPSNQTHIDHAIEAILATGKKSIGLIGLSFKTGTDDLRESPLVIMAERFIGKGLNLRIYDPEVNLSRLIGANRRYIEEVIPHIASLISDDCGQLVEQSDVIVIGLSDRDAVEAVYNRSRPDQFVYDLVNVSQPQRVKARYEGVCW